MAELIPPMGNLPEISLSAKVVAEAALASQLSKTRQFRQIGLVINEMVPLARAQAFLQSEVRNTEATVLLYAAFRKAGAEWDDTAKEQLVNLLAINRAIQLTRARDTLRKLQSVDDNLVLVADASRPPLTIARRTIELAMPAIREFSPALADTLAKVLPEFLAVEHSKFDIEVWEAILIAREVGEKETAAAQAAALKEEIAQATSSACVAINRKVKQCFANNVITVEMHIAVDAWDNCFEGLKIVDAGTPMGLQDTDRERRNGLSLAMGQCMRELQPFKVPANLPHAVQAHIAAGMLTFWFENEKRKAQKCLLPSPTLAVPEMAYYQCAFRALLMLLENPGAQLPLQENKDLMASARVESTMAYGGNETHQSVLARWGWKKEIQPATQLGLRTRDASVNPAYDDYRAPGAHPHEQCRLHPHLKHTNFNCGAQANLWPRLRRSQYVAPQPAPAQRAFTPPTTTRPVHTTSAAVRMPTIVIPPQDR